MYNSECYAIYLSGDLNSRFGLDLDFLPSIDDICNRKVIDKSKNKHEKELLNFLLESKMIVCNARLTTQFDNCTVIDPAKGSSVDDYFIVPINVLKHCLEFKVHTAREMINKYCNVTDVHIDLSNNIPDHSILTLTVNTSYVLRLHDEPQPFI